MKCKIIDILLEIKRNLKFNDCNFVYNDKPLKLIGKDTTLDDVTVPISITKDKGEQENETQNN